MKNYIKQDPWLIIEDGFDKKLHPISESLMSIGNGRMGQRANFEESYSGESLQGSYIGGVYYPDKTRVGWWKIGYPEYFAKVLNSVNWIGLQLVINGQKIDLATVEILSFHRVLDMKKGVLRRDVVIGLQDGSQVNIKSERFYSIVDQDTCFLKYSITALNNDLRCTLIPSLDFNVRNSDANYDEDFWQERKQGFSDGCTWVLASTKKTNFLVACSAKNHLQIDESETIASENILHEGIAGQKYQFDLSQDQTATLYKYVAITSSFYHEEENVVNIACEKSELSSKNGYNLELDRHANKWLDRWSECDIEIAGDIAAQQGIRFNIYHLYQTYSGEDSRLNIGPKGFTGEKYGGSTYWDTEAYCLPFYMCTTSAEVARNLLVYRYKQLPQAIDNAAKLGFTDGAALYPMVTMTGEECHNEWEITFEEIHRNGAIAFAIYNYIRYTNDEDYLIEYGLEVLIAIARFWVQRCHLSPIKQQYVMLGVTGPNEYENNVDNNWYTNYIARWCINYAKNCIETAKSTNPNEWENIKTKTEFHENELTKWDDIRRNMFLPTDEEKGIFLQQEGFLNKEDLTVEDIKDEHRPINQNWSWDRILRSPFIKQADVLQGLYFFEDQFSEDELRNNFLYYEPKTVHESSLSPCVHSILAAKLAMHDKAYEMYLRTARLDLDDYNNDTEDGCHITSMAGTWMSVVEGFAGLRMHEGHLSLTPFLPLQWDSFRFKINFRGSQISIAIERESVAVENKSDRELTLYIFGEKIICPARDMIAVPMSENISG